MNVVSSVLTIVRRPFFTSPCRRGYWLNLSTMEFEVKEHAPGHSLVSSVNGMFTFQGLPTIFGSPECDEDFECSLTEVAQYDPELDLWIKLGSLLESRELFNVVEVPAEYCSYFTDDFEDGPTETPIFGPGGNDDDDGAVAAASSVALVALLAAAVAL